MQQIPFLLLLLCVHMAWAEDSTQCEKRFCEFGKCVDKKCHCDPGFTLRKPWFLQELGDGDRFETDYDFGCKLIMDTHIPGACARNATCAIGASCKNDMCTCDEPGWRTGLDGTMYQTMCTAGTVKNCKVNSTSSSKCLRPIFVRCLEPFGCDCNVANLNPHPYYFLEHKCNLRIEERIKLPTKEFRLYWKIPPYEDECPDGVGEPEYTCGCKEGEKSCNQILGAKCSGGPDPDCYVPSGIFCNQTIGKCDCDRSQGYILLPQSSQCRGIPGAKCRKTEDCVTGSKCTGGKCSSCPGTQTVEWKTAKCVLNIMDPCKEDRDCPQGMWCYGKDSNDDTQGKVCQCLGELVEYDPKINECVALARGQCGDLHYYGYYLRNCKTGDGTVCEDSGDRNFHFCECDKNLGLTGFHNERSVYECLVMHNHPCEPNGIKCLQDGSYYKTNWECLNSKDNGDQYTCVDANKGTTPKGNDEDWDDNFGENGHRNIIGSIAVIGFGLAVAVAAVSALNY